MFAGGDCLQAKRDVELVGDGHDDRLDLWIVQHVLVLSIGDARTMNDGHLRDQILGDIANGVEFGVARLAAGVEMGDLRNRPAAGHADAEEARFLFHDAISGYRCRKAVRRALSFCRSANETNAGKCFSAGSPLSSPERWTSR